MCTPCTDRLPCCRPALYPCAAADDGTGRAAVPQRPQDVQQYTTMSAHVLTHQHLVHRRRIRPPGTHRTAPGFSSIYFILFYFILFYLFFYFFLTVFFKERFLNVKGFHFVKMISFCHLKFNTWKS